MGREYVKTSWWRVLVNVTGWFSYLSWRLSLLAATPRVGGWLLANHGDHIAPSGLEREDPRLGKMSSSCRILRRLCAKAKRLAGRWKAVLFLRLDLQAW